MSTLYRLVLGGICCLAITCSTATLNAMQRPSGNPGREKAPDTGRGETPGIVESSSASNGQGRSRMETEDLLESGDLSRFRGYKEEAIGDGWSVDDNVLHFDGSKGGDIVTVDEYDNFELQFDWKVSPGGNSGVMYRVSLGDNAPYLSGPEYQVLDDTRHKDGENSLTSAGSLYALYAPSDEKKRKAGIWNKSKIIVDGNKVTHYLNNKKVVKTELGSDDWEKRVAESKFKSWEKFGKNKSGHIAFQDHGDEVWYRNIKIKRLESSSNADGKTGESGRAMSKGQYMRSAPGAPAVVPSESVEGRGGQRGGGNR